MIVRANLFYPGTDFLFFGICYEMCDPEVDLEFRVLIIACVLTWVRPCPPQVYRKICIFDQDGIMSRLENWWGFFFFLIRLAPSFRPPWISNVGLLSISLIFLLSLFVVKGGRKERLVAEQRMVMQVWNDIRTYRALENYAKLIESLYLSSIYFRQSRPP